MTKIQGEFNFQWHITNLCNLRCKHCYQEDFSSDSDLKWPEIKSICDNIISYLQEENRSTRIDLTGGEPFLKKELFDLLDYLDRSNPVRQLNIITNAIVLDKKTLIKLKDYRKLKMIKVSLESLDEALCDEIRKRGVFRKVIDALRLLKEERFEVILMFTILKKNIDEIPKILDLCYKYNLDGVILERFIPLGRGYAIRDQVLQKDDWRRALELLSSIFSSKYDLVDLLPYKAFWIKTKRTLKLLGARCNIGDTLCIMPNGDVLPCRRFNLSIGNLLKDSLGEIRKHFLLRELKNRDFLRGRCKVCQISDCIGCRAIAYSLTGDYFLEDPQCFW